MASSRTSLWIASALALVGAALGASRAQAPSPAVAATADVVLDEARQKEIWDYEHYTFLIENYYGKPLVEALRRQDRDAVLSRMRAEFSGQVLSTEAGETRKSGLVSETRRKLGEVPAVAVDAAGYADRLLGYFRPFQRIDRARLQGMFIDRVDPEKGRWQVTVLLSAGGVGEGGAPLEHTSTHRAELVFDDDEAIKQGRRIVARMEILSESHRSSPRFLMEEVTEQVGLAAVPLPDNWKLPTRMSRTHRYQFAVEDFDRDGYPDIAVSATNGRGLLLRNVEGKRFEDVTEAMGIKPSADMPKERMVNALAGWIDYDNDGFPDLLMGYRLYHNVGGKKLEIVGDSGLKFERSPFGCVVADYDGDGLLDLYIVNQKGFRRRPPGKRPWVGDMDAGTENHLWRNEGGGRFRNVTAAANAGGGRHQTFAAAALFLNDDPFPDLYLANDFGTNVLLRNRGDGTFEDITEPSGTGDFSTSMGVSAGDLDNDGQPELYVANMYSKMGRRIVAHVGEEDYPPGLYDMIRGSLAGNRLYRLGPDGVRYEELSKSLGINSVGWAFAPAMVDLDGNGWLDIYAATGFTSTDRTKPDG